MNKIYKVVYCKATQTMVAVSEFAKAHGKGGSVSVNKKKLHMPFSGQLKMLSVAVLLVIGGQSALAGSIAIGENSDVAAIGGKDVAKKGSADASGNDSVSIGDNASATKDRAVALGTSAEAGHDSVVVGNKASATKDQSVAIGSNAEASAGQSIAIGSRVKRGFYNCDNSGIEDIVHCKGGHTIASGPQSMALGANTWSQGDSSIAMGGDDLENLMEQTIQLEDGGTANLHAYYAEKTGFDLYGQEAPDSNNLPAKPTGDSKYTNTSAKGHGAIAIGVKSIAGGALTATLGTASQVDDTAHFGVALGSGSHVTKENAVALGAGSLTKEGAVYHPQSTVPVFDEDGNLTGETVGYLNYAGGAADMKPGDQVSVGSKGFERQIKHVAPAVIAPDSTDAVNGSQLFSVAKETNTQIQKLKKGMDTYFHMNTIDASQGAGDPATNLGGIGDKAGALGDHSMTAGLEAKATGVNAIAMGYQAHAGPDQVSQVKSNMLAVGYDARAEGINSTAIGFETRAKAKDTVALGNGAVATGDTGIALGKQTDAAGNFSISIGLDSRASGSGSVAVGSGAFAGEETAAPDGFIYATALGNDSKG